MILCYLCFLLFKELLLDFISRVAIAERLAV
jgi:hypothetical protein